MNAPVCIQLEKIDKRFWLYHHSRERLGQLLLSPITRRDYGHAFWALRNVDLEVRQGETLGIIGVNGSGKSTLLQIISGMLQPTSGSVKVHGRLTALLELGAGFHTEFTGRENIILNGATMGIPEKEMKRHLDQIIDFADIGEFIDQPVKLYSSGMYVRLGFAIATSVDPEILIVDEALAVGDIGFVFKCMNRMQQLRNQGTAIVLVTHDVQTVRSFCDQVLWLAHGTTMMKGGAQEVTSTYVQYLWEQRMPPKSEEGVTTLEESHPQNEAFSIANDLVYLNNQADLIRWGMGGVTIEGFQIDNGISMGSNTLEYGQQIKITVKARANQDIDSDHIGVGICFRNVKGLDVITCTTYDDGNRIKSLHQGQTILVTFELENILAPGDYALVINVEERSEAVPQYYDFIENASIIKSISHKLIHSLVLPEVKQKIEVI